MWKSIAFLFCSAVSLAVALSARHCRLDTTNNDIDININNRRSFLETAGSQIVAPILVTTSSMCFHPSEAVADAPAVLNPGGVAGLGGMGGPSLVGPPYQVGSWSVPSSRLTTKLSERIQATQLSPLNQIVLPFSEQEVYYPAFMLGSWELVSTLKSKKFPFGTDVVPSNSLIDGSPRNRQEQVGDTTSYEVRYFSTASKQPKIVADRAFNAISVSKAYKQLVPVQEVEWDYRKDPTQLTLRFAAGSLTEDMRPLGQRRAEVYITARATEDGLDNESGSLTFSAAERTRSVTLAPGNVIVSDSEIITEFRKIDDDHIKAISRIAVYLTPNPNSREGVLWQQVQGKAVAFYDYEWDMTKMRESSTATF